MNKEDKEFLAFLVVYATDKIETTLWNLDLGESIHWNENLSLKELLEKAKRLVKVSEEARANE